MRLTPRPITLASIALLAFAALAPATSSGRGAASTSEDAQPPRLPAPEEARRDTIEATADASKKRAYTNAFSEGSARSAQSQGARWLKQNQNADGGWGAESWARRAGPPASDAATTSLAVLALMRDAGPQNEHRQAIEKGVRFVVRSVEGAPAEGPRIQGPDGTQPQRKLGQNVDTHFASLLFGELEAGLGAELDGRVQVAYDKVLSKVVAAQHSDGSFDSSGWAPVLSSSVAAQGLTRAYERGKSVEPEALARSDEYQHKLVDRKTGEFDASAGAGVSLYAAASALRGNRDAAKRAASPQLRERAEAAADATAQAVRRDRGQLVAGFGSIGGEEMLSYMMISDSMVEAGGDPWDEWQQRIGGNLIATQNADGSWSGHHCITSTPFVTAAAVMTLASGDAHSHKHARAGS